MIKQQLACTPAQRTLTCTESIITDTVHCTHSWHSVEIFNSLVLPRKILTRAPKFPVLGLFSTWEREEGENVSAALRKLQKLANLTVWHANNKKKLLLLYATLEKLIFIITKVLTRKTHNTQKDVYIIDNLLRTLARGITASSSNLESPLFKRKTREEKS